jgi:hypothetical protein
MSVATFVVPDEQAQRPLAGYWLGLYAAIVVRPADAFVALILTLAMGGHVRAVWFAAQVGLLLWGIWLLFQVLGGSISLQ